MTPVFDDESSLRMPATPQPTKVTFWQGYSVDEDGIRCWPFRGYRHRWTDLERIEYVPYTYNGRGMFRLKLFFVPASARQAKIECGAGLKNLAKVNQVLRWARTARPEIEAWKEPPVIALVRGGEALASWAPVAGLIPDEKLLLQAEIRMAALERKAAIKDCRTLIDRRSEFECRAARLKIEAELIDWNTEDAIDTLSDLLSRHPEEIEAREMIASYLLAIDDARGPEMARVVFDRNPAGFPALVFNCAAFFVRRRRWDEAAATLGQLEAERARLGPQEIEAIDRYRAELANLRSHPSHAFRTITMGKVRALLPAYAFLLVFMLLVSWPLVTVGPLLWSESWKLWQLRDHGLRAEVVRGIVLAPRPSRAEHWLSTIHFRIAPSRSQIDPLTLNELSDVPLEEKLRWIDIHSSSLPIGVPRGWYHGEAILFDSTAKEIARDPSLQFATYLPGRPAINTIGPITNTRIWLTWVGAPRATLPAVFLVVVFSVMFARGRIRRSMRKWRGDLELRSG